MAIVLPPTKDRERALEIYAGLVALGGESVTIRRRIVDRYGARPIATIEYTLEEFAAKLADGMYTAYQAKPAPAGGVYAAFVVNDEEDSE